MSSKPHKKNWQDQSPIQRLSNRTILRFQQLADELKNDLGRVFPRETGVQSVLFVSADRGKHRFGQNKNQPRRFYNARLLRTYQFTKKNDKVWQWIKDSLDVNHRWKENRTGFEQLFSLSADIQGLKNEFSTFEDAVKRNYKEKAHDLLIDAIATLPYTGFLPGCFDSFSRGKESDWPKRVDHPISTFHVKLDENKDFLVVMTSSCPEAKKEECKLEVEEILSNGSMSELAKLFFPLFIEHFVMGREAIENPGCSNLFRISEEDGSNDPLQGLFIPVYDFNDESGRGAGGFEGWLIVLMKSPNVKAGSEIAIAMAVQNFASRASEERMRELIERPWTDAMSPAMFTKLYYGHYGGWEGEGAEEMKHQFDSELPFVYLKESDNGLIQTRNIHKITHIAIRIRNYDGRGGDLWLVFRRRCDTILPGKNPYFDDYGYQIARSVNDLYQAARLRHEEIQRSKLSASLAAAHDYSKDLNAIDMTFGRLGKMIEQKKQSIPNLVKDFPELKEAVVAQLDDLELEYIESSVRDRFMMSHQRVLSENFLYEQPQWCVDLLREGTRQSIYRILRLLVWQPLGSNRYRELAEVSEPEVAEVADWSRLFAYDESGVYPEIDDYLASHLRSCFAQRMSDEEFGRKHPPPVLNPDDEMEQRILWKPPGFSDQRFVPGRLLPLFVFSLRAAFQHAWLTSFFKAALSLKSPHFTPVAETVTLEEHESAECYRMTLSFPNPLAVEGLPLSRRRVENILPWGIDWDRQIGHYGGHTGPWKANVQRDEVNQRILITITT